VAREVADILEELLAWTRFAHLDVMKRALRDALGDAKAFRAYELSDGTRSQAEVATAAGVSQPTVSRMWSRWERLGLMRDVDGKLVHLARPSDLGLEPPG
jgi:hypothetical protein